MGIGKIPGAIALGMALVALSAPVASAGLARVGSEPSRTRPAAHAWRMANYPQALAATVEFVPLPVERIEAVRNRNATSRKVSQVGIARFAANEARADLPALRWVAAPGGGAVARILVDSPEAPALRVGLHMLGVAEGMEFRFAGTADPSRVAASVAAAQVRQLAGRDGVYWTPVTEGRAQIIEVYAPPGVPVQSVDVEVSAVSHFLAGPRAGFQVAAGSEACQVDAVCRVDLGADFVEAKDAVARMAFTVDAASYVCTGTLLNDADPATQVPYFYTAHHCVGWQGVANTVVTTWGYEAASCGSAILADFQALHGGAEFLYGDELSDVALLRLYDPAPSNATFSGWSAEPVGGDVDVTAIHHPSGDVKKVSFGRTVAEATDDVLLGAGWVTGATEEGSSGSGLFVRSPEGYQLVGGLLGGYSSCATVGNPDDPDNWDFYSRLDKAFPYIHRYISAGTGNGPPLPGFDFTSEGRTVRFVDASVDHDGTVVAWHWDFGDGTTSSEPDPVKAYAADGDYTVVLTATDDQGASLGTSGQVHVAEDAGPDLGNGEGDAITAAAGETFRYTVTLPRDGNFLRIQLIGDNGDADLYVKREAPPTATAFDCRSNSGDSIETCHFSSPPAGVYHILVVAYDAFSDVTVVGTYDLPYQWRGPSATDFGADGASDIFWRNTTTGAGVIWHSADSAASARVRRVANTAWEVVAVGDFDGYGFAGLLWRNVETGANAIWPEGDAAQARQVTRVRIGHWEVAGAGDFDGDHQDDLFWRNARTGENVIWRGADSGTRQLTGSAPPDWEVAAIADFNGDRKDDVLWHNREDGRNTIWLSANRGTVQPVTGLTNPAWEIAGAGDFEGDGYADVLWRNRVTGANAIWPGASHADARSIKRITDPDWEIVGIGDYDGNGEDDILWRHAVSGRNTIWQGGEFADSRRMPAVRNSDWVVID